MALAVKNPPTNQCGRCKRQGFDPWIAKIPLEKEMAARSRILAWSILWTEEPGGLQSTGSRVGHNLATKGRHPSLNAHRRKAVGTDQEETP